MTLSEDLVWRGLIKDRTFSDPKWLDEPKTFYHGVDCSSDSLTIGNLAALTLARRFADYGWKTVILIGGATSLVGDPGGKSEERELKEKSEIEHNVAAIKAQVEKLFDGKDVTYVNNADWFSELGYLDFLRDVGKHYSMTELTQRDYIAERMGKDGSGISYAEFSYTLIQGYDFWHLFKNHGTVLQVGGSDQWGNMLSGAPLIRKKENAEVHVMTMPLVIDKTTGVKFGKSEEGAVWLDPAKTSPYKFYQFWLNVDDEGAIDYLKIYSFLDHGQIDQVKEQHSQNPNERLAQKNLAFELTKQVHGTEVAERVKKITEVLFSGQGYDQLTGDDFAGLTSELPLVEAGPGKELIEVLVAGGLAASNSEARRFLADNAVYVNGQQFSLEKTSLDEGDFINGYCIVRRGKNTQAIVRKV